MKIERGISQRDLDALWVLMGGTIVPIRRTGERRYAHPSGRCSTPYSRRRKDASVKLIAFVRRIVREPISESASVVLVVDPSRSIPNAD